VEKKVIEGENAGRAEVKGKKPGRVPPIPKKGTETA